MHAVAYDRQGQIVAEDRVVTAGKPAKIGLHAEKTQLGPDGQDLLYLYFDVLDKDGNWVPSVSNQLHLKIEGPARIVGVDNGRQASRERYKAQKNGQEESLSWQRCPLSSELGAGRSSQSKS